MPRTVHGITCTVLYIILYGDIPRISCNIVGLNMKETHAYFPCNDVALPEVTCYENTIVFTRTKYDCPAECEENNACLSFFVKKLGEFHYECVLSQILYDCRRDLTGGQYAYASMTTQDHTPRSCADVQILSNQFQDGEYCLSLSSSESVGAWIYCHGMGTCDATSYLTLPRGEDENYSYTKKGPNRGCTYGFVKFRKIGLDLEDMAVKSWDWTFATPSAVHYQYETPLCDAYPLYGRAFSCADYATGRTKVDLRDTGFYIPSYVSWIGRGHGFTYSVRTQTDQTFYGECTGDCAGCVPQDSTIAETTYYSNTTTDKVMPIAYAASYDTNPCSFS